MAGSAGACIMTELDPVSAGGALGSGSELVSLVNNAAGQPCLPLQVLCESGGPMQFLNMQLGQVRKNLSFSSRVKPSFIFLRKRSSS